MTRVNSTAMFTPVHAEKIVIENFPKNIKRVLDFGCGDGRFTRKLLKGAQRVYGCDIDKAQVQNNKKDSNGISYDLIKVDCNTPYPDGYFDCITLMGVLEHVADEAETLQELHRILSPGGKIFIYVHNKGLLRFLDSANIKFISPSIHRFLYFIFYNKEKYLKEFVEKKKQGMFGDFTEGRDWHTHYSVPELKKHLGNNFLIEKVWFYSLFLPILLVGEFLYVSIFKKLSKFISWLIKLDNKISLGKLSYSYVMQCQKS